MKKRKRPESLDRGPHEKKTPHIQLQAEGVARLPHTLLRFQHSGKGSLAFAVGIAVFNEQPVKGGFHLGHQPGFNHPVGKGRGDDFPQLRFLHRKTGTFARFPGAGKQPVRQFRAHGGNMGQEQILLQTTPASIRRFQKLHFKACPV